MNQTAGTTLEHAARSTFVIETTTQPPQPANAAFERLFPDPKWNGFIGWNPPSRTIRGYVLPGAVLDGAFSGLWNAHGFIRGTNYLHPEAALLQVSIDQRQIVRTEDDNVLIVGCNHIYNNYFHWITQALPAIDSSFRRDGQVRRPTLGLPRLQPWHEETLALLGYHDAKRLTLEDTAKYYAFKRVEFNEFLNGGGAFCNSALAYQTYSRMRQQVPRETTEGRRIYVARTDTPRRRMRNESALLEEMRRRGFEIVVPGVLPVAQQIRIFREASLVVGPHGAGLTNIVFCEPGTIVYELLPKHYGNICFYNLGQICRLRYWMDAFESDGEGHPSARDWDADLNVIKDRLDEIDRVQAAISDEASRQPISAIDFLRGSPGYLPGQKIHEAPVPDASLSRPGLWRRLFGQR